MLNRSTDKLQDSLASEVSNSVLDTRELRRLILVQSKKAGVGHIGSSLSVVEIISALYGSILKVDSTASPDRDRFILSKGHAALALYSALFMKGFITQSELDTFCQDGSRLSVHPGMGVRGIDFCTGSLGQGLSLANGAALAARLQKSKRRIFVLMSDAELNEGSIWESAMFAAHHKLSNLVAIIDINGQQALGHTRDVLALPNLVERWKSFGWNVNELDGHHCISIENALKNLDENASQPHVILARTTFGKGVSFMENQLQWHYNPISELELAQALSELEQ